MLWQRMCLMEQAERRYSARNTTCKLTSQHLSMSWVHGAPWFPGFMHIGHGKRAGIPL